MPSCCRCNRPAVTLIRYNGRRYCRIHFSRFVEERVKKEIRRQTDLTDQQTIAVALSGGKDSSVALFLLYNIFRNRHNMSLTAITIDEGIAGYRNATIKAATTLCRELGVAHNIVTFKSKLGVTLDEIANKCKSEKRVTGQDFAPCTYCGVLRRWLLNRTARIMGANLLATGLNLDDTAQSVLMNIARGDTAKFSRMAPHGKTRKGLVPRLLPLRIIPEKETFLYAKLNGILFDHSVCPFSHLAARNRFRDLVTALEADSPGTRHALLKSLDRIAKLETQAEGSVQLHGCVSCGEPTGRKMCKACTLLETMTLYRI